MGDIAEIATTDWYLDGKIPIEYMPVERGDIGSALRSYTTGRMVAQIYFYSWSNQLVVRVVK